MVRAARRDSCSSISASSPIASGSGSSSSEQPAEPDRLARQVGARQRLAGRCRVALVEDQVDHAQHAVEPLGSSAARRHLVGNARVADLGLGAHDALRQRGRAR